MPPKKRTQSAIIRANMPQILEWASQGFTLTSIHQSLKEDEIIECGYANFARCYQQFKDNDETSATGNEPSSDIEPIKETGQPVELASKKREATPLPASTEQSRSQPVKRIEVDSQADRERRRKIAKAIFASYRNEQ